MVTRADVEAALLTLQHDLCPSARLMRNMVGESFPKKLDSVYHTLRAFCVAMFEAQLQACEAPPKPPEEEPPPTKHSRGGK